MKQGCCVALLCSAVFATVAEGSDPAARGSRERRAASRSRHGIMSRLSEVNVNDAQRSQIRGVLRESRPTMHPLVKQYMQERRALRQLIHTVPVNEAAIRAQSARVSQVKSELDVKRAHMAQRVRAHLTPQQIEKLKELETRFDRRMDAMVDQIDNKPSDP